MRLTDICEQHPVPFALAVYLCFLLASSLLVKTQDALDRIGNAFLTTGALLAINTALAVAILLIALRVVVVTGKAVSPGIGLPLRETSGTAPFTIRENAEYEYVGTKQVHAELRASKTPKAHAALGVCAGKEHAVLVAVAVVLVLVLSALIKLIGDEGSPFGKPFTVNYLILCILTGIQEEGMLCGILLPLFMRASQNRSRAQWQSALLFGLAHLLGMYSFSFALLKIGQAMLFGYCMTELVLRTERLWAPMSVHAAFDAVYFAIL